MAKLTSTITVRIVDRGFFRSALRLAACVRDTYGWDTEVQELIGDFDSSLKRLLEHGPRVGSEPK